MSGSYGSSTSSSSAGSGSSGVAESANLTGLTSNTLYHYRVEATNFSGTVYGADQTFITAPASTALPVISGLDTKGQILTTSNGSWGGSVSLGYVYQWNYCSSTNTTSSCTGGAWTAVSTSDGGSGGTTSSYTVGTTEVGHVLEVVVTATNITGGASATSVVTSSINGIAPGTPSTPTLISNAPAYNAADSSSAASGATAGTPSTTSYSYQWQSCSTTLTSSCADISGATSQSYTPSSAYIGDYLRVGVTASNTQGNWVGTSAIAYSAESTSAVSGGHWGSAVSIDGTTLSLSVSCVSSSFCIAGPNAAKVLTYNGSSWGSTTLTGYTQISATACTSTSFCVIGGGGYVSTYNGSWCIQIVIESGTVVISSISCPTASFCVATDNKGDVLTYTGSSWSAANDVDSTNYLYSVSCVSSSFCVAVDYSGNAVVYNGSSWNATATGASNLTSVSCVSSSFCVAVGVGDYAYTYNGSSWTQSSSTITTAILNGISCTSVSFCAAVGNSGSALIYNGSSWSPQNAIDGSNRLTSVSCVFAAYCVAVDSVGNAFTYTAPVPSATTSAAGTISGSSAVANGSVNPGGYATVYQFDYGLTSSYGSSTSPSSAGSGSSSAAESAVLSGLAGNTVYHYRIEATNSSGTSYGADQAFITAPNSSILPYISGTSTDGQTLTVSNGSWGSAGGLTYAYQWQRCSNTDSVCGGGTWNNILSATSNSYTLTDADARFVVRAQVTASNSSGSASAVSAVTSNVMSLAPTSVSLPIITGTITDGQTLSASTGSWSGSSSFTYAYQWQRCNSSGLSCVNASGVTLSNYILQDPDTTSTVRVQVTATDPASSNTAASAVTSVISSLPPTSTVAPIITGTTTDGQTLSASTGSWSGSSSFTYTYQWQRYSSSGSGCVISGAPLWQNITSATNQTYVLQDADIGCNIQVIVTASDSPPVSSSSVSSQTVSVSGVPPSSPSTPTITSEPVYNISVSSSVGAGSSGIPAPTYLYQWQVCLRSLLLAALIFQALAAKPTLLKYRT